MSARKVGAPSRKDEYIDEVKRLYVEQKHTLGEISQVVPVSIQTLSRWLHDEGIALEVRARNSNAGRTPEQQAAINRKISEKIQANIAEGKAPRGRTRVFQDEERTCECGEKFTVRANSTQRFHSLSCARQHQGHAKQQETEARWLTSPKSLCSCGVNRIPYAYRDTWRYCSDECRQQYGGKRQPDPLLQVTFTCETCGTEHTRRRRKGLPWRFCSNTCAAKHTKTVKHYVLREDDMVIDSTWEALVVGLLGFLKIPVARVDRALAVTTESGAVYAPDFFVTLPTVVAAIEVKGYDSGQQHEGWAAWRQEMGPLAIVDHDLLDRLRLMTSADQVERVLLDATLAG